MMLLLQYTMGLALKGNQPNMGIEHDELTVYLPYVAYGSGG